MTELRNLCPAVEEVWVSYYTKDSLLFFLTGPAGMSSTLASQNNSFTLYAVTSGKGGQKAKKLGSGNNPNELEAKYKVADAIKTIANAS